MSSPTDLLPGETMLWTGQPKQGLLLTPWDVVLIPISAAWLGMAYWMLQPLSKDPPFPAAVMILFFAWGAYFFAGRFLFDALVRRRTSYGVTDRRVLILKQWPWRTTIVINIADLEDVSIREDGAQRGTISFAKPSISTLLFSNKSLWVPSMDETPRFLAVDEGAQVFNLIQRVKAANHA